MLIFAEMTWNDPDVVVYSFQCHSCVLVESIQDSNFSIGMDYGRPMKPFFIEIPKFRAWTDHLDGQILGQLGYFWPVYQHPFWYSFSLINHYF